MKNSGDNVFDGIPVGGNEASLFGDFLAAHDLADHSRRRSPRTSRSSPSGSHQQRRTVQHWSGHDQRHHRLPKPSAAGLRASGGDNQPQSGHDSSVLAWLTEQGYISANPAKPVKELNGQPGSQGIGPIPSQKTAS